MRKSARPTVVTRVISGHSFTLFPGIRYLASRPMSNTASSDERFTVTIRRILGGADADKIEGLTYEKANKLLNKFNRDGGHRGRLWK